MCLAILKRALSNDKRVEICAQEPSFSFLQEKRMFCSKKIMGGHGVQKKGNKVRNLLFFYLTH